MASLDRLARDPDVLDADVGGAAEGCEVRRDLTEHPSGLAVDVEDGPVPQAFQRGPSRSSAAMVRGSRLSLTQPRVKYGPEVHGWP